MTTQTLADHPAHLQTPGFVSLLIDECRRLKQKLHEEDKAVQEAAEYLKEARAQWTVIRERYRAILSYLDVTDYEVANEIRACLPHESGNDWS